MTDAVDEAVTLARLDVNVGNSLFQQAQYQEALGRYRRASAGLEKSRDARDLATVLSNIAECFIRLGQFRQALEHYRTVRKWCVRHKLHALTAGTEYHIAHLHHWLGERKKALALYRVSREHCEKTHNADHSALCDLAESEILLELGIPTEAGCAAERAAEAFERLEMNHERAQATLYQGVASFRRGDSKQAHKLFHEARKLFAREENRYWRAVLDLYQAVAYEQDGLRTESRTNAERALGVQRHSPLIEKLAFCYALLARLCLAEGNLEGARNWLAEMPKTLLSPALRFQFHYLRGVVHERSGESELALQQYEAAAQEMETPARGAWLEELKLSFEQDKTEVYEAAIRLILAKGKNGSQEAFHWVQRAKAKRLFDRLYAEPASEFLGSAIERDEITELRRNISARSFQLDAEALAPHLPDSAALRTLRLKIQQDEQHLSRLCGEVQQVVDCLPTPAIQEALPEDTTLVEFFPLGGRMHAWIVTRESLNHVECGHTARIETHLRLWQFQLGKFGLGADYVARFEHALLEAAQLHLSELYQALIEPLRGLLNRARIIFAPGVVLHPVPFHALLDAAGEALLDHYTISYASASLSESARVPLVNLWEAPAETTTKLMLAFYHRFFEGGATDKAAALRHSMLKVRESNPHPYFWAPFELVCGEPAGNSRAITQALLRRGDYCIALQTAESGNIRTSLIGQIANEREPLTLANQVPVALVAGKRVLQQSTCNGLGEFMLDFVNQSRLRLRFDLAAEGLSIDVALKDFCHGST